MQAEALDEGGELALEAVVKTLLVTDLVDSTRLVERLGDAAAAEIFQQHDRAARDLLAEHRGREIDKTDGFLLLFDRPHDAVAYALAYHRRLNALSSRLGVQLHARVGIHLGEVFLHHNDPRDVARGAKPLEVEGLAKPIAARIMSAARGKQTLLSRGAFDLARDAEQAAEETEAAGGEHRWLAHGPYLLHGIDDPIELFEVGEVGIAPLAAPADSPKVRRAVTPGEETTLGWRPAPGQTVPERPHWRLDRRLGEGGFGEVWLAVHRHTGDRRVFKFCYQADKLRALQREVTLFRLLKETLGSRPDIARILDWSFDEAPYYLESEYSADGSLVDWAEAQGGLDSIPIELRLELGAQVADALAAAHSVGVLHKDVKPSNVLVVPGVDGRPQAQLTDFGIGLITDRSLLLARGITAQGLTEMGSDGSASTGTRLYMAPELMAGAPASVQADVYALGVMIYQLVVGDFQSAPAPGWRRDVEDEVLADDLASFLDLSPERRPGSALEVAGRLRSLDERRAQRAEEAARRRREEENRRLLERAQRRRKLSAVIAGVSVLVLAVVSVLAVQAVQARSEAEVRRGQAEDLISFMLGDLRAKLDAVGRLEILDDVGDKALEYFDSLPQDDLSDGELFRRSRALMQIGEVRVAEGDLPAAAREFKASLELARQLSERHPDHLPWLKGLGDSQFWVGYVLWDQGDLEQATRYFEGYLVTAQKLVEREPDNPDWRLELAYAHSNLGSVLEARRDLDGALERFETTLALKQQLAEEHPEELSYLSEVATSHNLLATLHEQRGEPDRALEHFRADLELYRQLHEIDPLHAQWRADLSRSHQYLARLLLPMGDPEAAKQHLRASERLLEDLVALDPSNTHWQFRLAVNHSIFGTVLRAEGEHRQALERFELQRSILDPLVAKDPTNALRQLELGVGMYLTAASRAFLSPGERALVDALAARDHLRSNFASNPDDWGFRYWLAQANLLLGELERAAGDEEQAMEEFRSALRLTRAEAGEADNARVVSVRARAMLHLGEIEGARRLIDRLSRIGYEDPQLVELTRARGVAAFGP